MIELSLRVQLLFLKYHPPLEYLFDDQKYEDDFVLLLIGHYHP
jgi:hypothetical protein